LRQIDVRDGAGLQLPQRCHGLVGVREQIATRAGIAVDADNAATNPAADPVDRNAEVVATSGTLSRPDIFAQGVVYGGD
jgi:hypothetical protein